MKKIEDIISQLKIWNAKKILMTLHPNPDLDSMCSNVSLAIILKIMGFKVTLILGDGPGDAIPSMFLRDIEMSKNLNNINQKKYDVFIILDIARMQRVSTVATVDESIKKIIIDHHVSNNFKENEITKVILDTNASSTCEIIARMLLQSKKSDYFVPLEMYFYLYLGIWSDTQSFSTMINKKTFLVLAKLLGKNPAITEKMLSFQKNKTISRKVQISEIAKSYNQYPIREYKIGIIQNDTDIPDSDVIGEFKDISDELIIIISEHHNYCHIEIQSWIDSDIAVVLARHLGGGGHKERSGATFHCGVAGYEDIKEFTYTFTKGVILTFLNQNL